MNGINLDTEKAWFHTKGSEYDVVISTRARLSRNLKDYPYPGVMEAAEERKVRDQVMSAMKYLSDQNSMESVYLRDIAPTERRMLLERSIINEEYSLKGSNVVFYGSEGNYSGIVNEVDHVRLSSFKGGMALKEAHDKVDVLDTKLEEHLNYAVSFDFGYLTTQVNNCGTGLRISAMLHLPGLVSANLIEAGIKSISQQGADVKGYFSDADTSRGDMYQISNQVSIGSSEKEIIEKLDKMVRELVTYERRAREEMYQRFPLEVEDRVHRAYGILSSCRKIEYKEAVEHISSVRMGISLGLIKDLSMEAATALLITSQKAHMQFNAPDKEKLADSAYIDYLRAEYIRKVLRGGSGADESNDNGGPK